MTAKRSIPAMGLAIDWETSGYTTPDYAKYHQGITFGAIVFKLDTLDPVEEIYREIQFDNKYRWEAGAEKIHKISRLYLAENGISQQQAAIDLGNLVIKYFGTEEVILLGHRVYFDKAFTNQLMDSIDVQLNYSPTMIDTCSFGTVFLEETLSDRIFNVMGLPPRQAHNALEDIQYTLLSMKLMKEMFTAGVGSIL